MKTRGVRRRKSKRIYKKKKQKGGFLSWLFGKKSKRNMPKSRHQIAYEKRIGTWKGKTHYDSNGNP